MTIHDQGPAGSRAFTWIATCGPCGITIGVRTDPGEAAEIASEHNRIHHPYDLGVDDVR